MAVNTGQTGLDLESLPRREPEGRQRPIIKAASVWKVFGKKPERALEPEHIGKSKPEVQSELSAVIGLRDVSFEVQRGQTFVIMGLSGSGKSTMVRCLTRLIEPTAGSIVIDGSDIMAMTGKELMEFRRSKVAKVFQHYGLMPHRNVLDNAAWGLEVQGATQSERYARTREILNLVGLAGWESSLSPPAFRGYAAARRTGPRPGR